MNEKTGKRKNTEIHPSAVVHPAAQIGERVYIGPNSVVEENTKIGEGTRIDANIKIGYGARIGRECHIFHGAVISEIPQDLKFGGEESTTVIGNNTVIREYSTIHRGTRDRKKTAVGSNCLLMAYTHLGHDCLIGDNVIIANSAQVGGHVTVDKWAYIGALTGIHQFTHIGKHAFIGGGYRCVSDVPPYILAAGEPLKFNGLNIVGLRRRNFSSTIINLLKEAYRILYRSEFSITQAIEQIQSAFEATEEIKEIVTFIQQSKRGIIY